jgi:hypothetical protein
MVARRTRWADPTAPATGQPLALGVIWAPVSARHRKSAPRSLRPRGSLLRRIGRGRQHAAPALPAGPAMPAGAAA